MLIGVGAIVAGSVPFVLVNEGTAFVWIALILTVLGFGLGLTTLATTIAVQNSVDWGRRGVATSVVLFARSMGGSIGVTVLGALLASDLAQRLAVVAGRLAVRGIRELESGKLEFTRIDLVRHDFAPQGQCDNGRREIHSAAYQRLQEPLEPPAPDESSVWPAARTPS